MKLSVVTVTRNALPDLQRTLPKVLACAGNDIELIVIDGASSDGTQDYLRSLTHERLSFISEPDTGIYNAMNKALNLTCGEFVYFLNAGDTLTDTDALNTVLTSLKGADVYYADVFLSERGKFRFQKHPRSLTLEFWLREHLCHQAVFFRRSLFGELGRYDENYPHASDYDFLLRAWLSAKRFEHLDIAIAVFDMHGLSGESSNHKRIREEYLAIQNRRLDGPRRFYNFLLRKANDWCPQGTPIAARLRRRLARELLSPLFCHEQGHAFDCEGTVACLSRPLRIAHLDFCARPASVRSLALSVHRALLDKNIVSQYFCLKSVSTETGVVRLEVPSSLWNLIASLPNAAEQMVSKLIAFFKPGVQSFALASSPAQIRLWKKLDLFDPDIIHIHGIGHAVLKVSDLRRSGRPILWANDDHAVIIDFASLSRIGEVARTFESSAATAEQLANYRDKLAQV